MAIILVADDDASIVEMLAELVSDHGHSAVLAYDGAMALSLARSCNPDLVITDVMMPRLDGYGLLREIRDDPMLSQTMVILMSAAFTQRTPPKHDPPVADNYLHKPLDLTVIERVLMALAEDS